MKESERTLHSRENIDRGRSYIDLNADVNSPGEEGEIQFDKDKEAARQYFLKVINPNTVYFHDLEEKLEYLFEDNYYDKDMFEQYNFDFVKNLYKRAYSYKFRFPTFVGAMKFYTQYAMKNHEENRYLERYEDRVTAVALYLAQGDEEMATKYLDEIMTSRMQPATPTFINAGKAHGGLPISCYLIDVQDNLESIGRAEISSMALSKMGGGVGINLTNIRASGDPIQKFHNKASGLIPFMKILENTFSWIDQLGARPGSGAVYVSVHHPDVMSVLDSKRENADEKIRIKTLSIGLVVTDILFEAAKRGEDIYQFSPYDVEREYGKSMSQVSITDNYDDLINNPNIKKTKISARKLLQTIAELQFESGYPYLMFEDNANRQNNAPNVGRIAMSNLCVTGDTQILTDKGYRKAIDLYGSQEDFNVVVDERARTFDLSNMSTSVQKSTKMFKTAESAEVFKLETIEGFEIKATAWHKMYVDREGELIKIPLAEVELGDKILVQPAASASFGKIHKPKEAYLCGAITADGTFSKQRNGINETVRIDMHRNKREFSNDILTAIHSVLQGREDLINKHNATLTPSIQESNHADFAYIGSAPLASALSELGFTSETKLQVPEFVINGDKETIQSYINGLFQFDGTITGSKTAKTFSIELTNISFEFLQQVQSLLLTLGIYTRIYNGRKAGRNLLPDGKGALKEYNVKQLYSLRATDQPSRSALHDIVSWRSDREREYKEHSSLREGKRVYTIHKHRATVKSIEFYGVEDVYDVTVDSGNSVIFNGISTGNCSEILQPQVPSTFNKDFSYKQVGMDISCNLASINIARIMENGENFGDTINTTVRALTSVSDQASIESVPSIDNGNKNSHAIGVGAMNLHGFLGKNFIKYGSFEALDFVNIYFSTVLFYAIQASNEIAREREETFYGFEGSRFNDGTFFEPFINARFDIQDEDLGGHDLFVKTQKVKEVLNKYDFSIPQRKDWEELKEKVEKYGLYNRNLIAVAPTGSISMVNGSTMSIHPVAAPILARKEKILGRVYWPAPEMTNENKDYFQSAFNLGSKAVIETYNAAAPYVDQGLSLTLYFNSDEATTKDLNKAYILAWNGSKTFHGRDTEDAECTWNANRRKRLGAVSKSVYYTRVQQKALIGTEVDNMSDIICESCQV